MKYSILKSMNKMKKKIVPVVREIEKYPGVLGMFKTV